MTQASLISKPYGLVCGPDHHTWVRVRRGELESEEERWEEEARLDPYLKPRHAYIYAISAVGQAHRTRGDSVSVSVLGKWR